jgi:hypothetical protein
LPFLSHLLSALLFSSLEQTPFLYLTIRLQFGFPTSLTLSSLTYLLIFFLITFFLSASLVHKSE